MTVSSDFGIRFSFQNASWSSSSAPGTRIWHVDGKGTRYLESSVDIARTKLLTWQSPVLEEKRQGC